MSNKTEKLNNPKLSEKQKEIQNTKWYLNVMRAETEFIASEERLMLNPKTMDKIDEINKRYEKAFEDEIINTKNELSSLLNMMEEKLNIINWVSTKNKDLVWKDWKIKWLTKNIDLESIIFKGQKLAIVNNKWKKQNIVWWKDKSWDTTYVIEWTKNRVILENGFKISTYTEKQTKTDKKEQISENRKSWKKSINKMITSSPFEKSKRWITLCSRTAHKNLQKLGVNSRRWNAIDVQRSYWKWKIKTYPFGDGKVIDLFVKTKSPYWHRAAAFFNNGECFVLDPYYPVMNGKRTTKPIPYKTYENGLKAMWRKVVWWVALA